ncbi:LuxR family transcriptional regulator [Streptomyces apricus]|uniref:LuxR family transcriptional regulator n=1 Tax=Streptomyces apricus TaxID=1828112 RepID=A0A5B0BGZ6_9ACTN|nr:LuxR family transcriptional regulator [Streptomyces apricus]
MPGSGPDGSGGPAPDPADSGPAGSGPAHSRRPEPGPASPGPGYGDTARGARPASGGVAAGAPATSGTYDGNGTTEPGDTARRGRPTPGTVAPATSSAYDATGTVAPGSTAPGAVAAGAPAAGGVPYDGGGAGPVGQTGSAGRGGVLVGIPLEDAHLAGAPAPHGFPPAGAPAGPAAGQPLLVAALAAALAAREEHVVLVLDDFQPESGSPVAEGVARLLRHAAPALRLVVVARRDPPLHLHRHRLAGDLTELRTGDLAFDDRETAALLAQHGVEVPRASVNVLRERTDGWAAGLRLAAMSMEGRPHPERLVAQFAGEDEAIVSYLVEEVLDGQPPAVRHLLLTTSVLDHLNAELATRLAGQESGRHFAALVEQNSFLQHVGHGWYRCHRMFCDVLRVRLRHEAPDLVPDLHGRAAEWLGEHGLLAEAVRHTLDAGDRDRADRLVVHHLAIGQVLGLTASRLPLDRLTRPRADPAARPGRPPGPESALVAAAAALARGEGPACAESLVLADRLIGELPDGETPGGADRIARCRLSHAVIRATRDRPRHPAAARTAAADAEHHFSLLPRALREERPELTALTLSVLGRAEVRDGGLKAAEVSLTAGLKAACAAGNGVLRRDCLSELALLEVLRGRFRAADQFAAHARQPPLPASAAPDPSLAALHVVRAWVALTRFDAARARGELARANKALRTVPDPFVTGAGSLVAGLITAVEGGAARFEVPDGLPGAWADGRLAEELRQTVRRTCAASLAEARAHPLAARLPGPRTAPEQPPREERPPVEQLSARERDVLRHLARMMTTEEIAEELYVSVNTVKTHLKSVYRKLSVTRRSAAVRRARELELL